VKHCGFSLINHTTGFPVSHHSPWLQSLNYMMMLHDNFS